MLRVYVYHLEVCDAESTLTQEMLHGFKDKNWFASSFELFSKRAIGYVYFGGWSVGGECNWPPNHRISSQMAATVSPAVATKVPVRFEPVSSVDAVVIPIRSCSVWFLQWVSSVAALLSPFPCRFHIRNSSTEMESVFDIF
ncbi:hypothetical protein ACFE04_010420 [Oxalis oulophora]